MRTGQPPVAGPALRAERLQSGGGVRTARPPLRAGRLALLLAAAVVVGLVFGRSAFFAAAPAPAPPPAARTPAQAVAQLERAVAADPDDLAGWQQLGIAYLRRAAETGDPAFYDLAGRAFDRADALAPDDPPTLLGRANLALVLHDFGRALELGSRLHAVNPYSDEALGVLVDAEIELGRYEAAAAHLQQMLDLNPGLAALARTAYLRELHGDLQGATRALLQAEAAGSGSAFDRATVTVLTGDLYLRRGDLQAAGEAYERAERAVPELVAAAVGRARVMAARGDRPAAIALLQGVVERFPQPAAVLLLGDLLAMEGRAAESADADALVRLIAALQQQSGQVTDLEMALFEADHGDAAAAVALARRAYGARPDNVYAADALAWALHRAGDSGAALPLVEQALRLGSADALVRYHAAAVYAGAGDEPRARAELGRAFALPPWFAFRHAADARALAARLGVAVPAAWTRP